MLCHDTAILVILIGMTGVAHEVVDCEGRIILLGQIADELTLAAGASLRIQNHSYFTTHFITSLFLVVSSFVLLLLPLL